MIDVAIDGTSASGKGTLAKKLSEKYSIPHLDTGLMYRKIASEILKGKGSNNSIDGGVEIHSKLDHRIAMSFLSLGLTSKKPIIVNDTETINSSFPNFLGVMNELGARLKYVN